jgi:hypothetical protein
MSATNPRPCDRRRYLDYSYNIVNKPIMLEFCVNLCNWRSPTCVSGGFDLESKQEDCQDQEQSINNDDDQNYCVRTNEFWQ